MLKLAVVMCVAVLAMPAPMAAQDDLTSPKLRMEWAEFKKLYDAGRLVVVDVRDPEAFEASRIPGSINVPLDEVAKRVDELKKHGKPIVFYCA
jgi:rhodanese-related sulfurtransferase